MENDVVAHNDGEDRAAWMMADDDGIQYFVDPDVGVDNGSIGDALRSHPELKSIAAWVNDINPAFAATNHRNRSRRSGGIIERDRYVTPDGFFDQFRVARDAAMHDDTVSNTLEISESLVFNTIRVDCADPDEENVWNQIIHEMKLDEALHQMWRELFTYSQFNCAMQWGVREYKVEGKGKSRTRRKSYDLNVVTSLSMLDQLKVIPVGDFLFGGEQLVYAANRVEAESIDNVLAGKNTTDQVVKNLLTSRKHVDQVEKARLNELLGEGDFSNLFYMNPTQVFRHTATKPDYERFAAVRMASVFELLDLKHQLRQMDRAHLMGATNFIVLIKKGSDQQPATSGEISHLNANVKTVARTPLIVGDHRLSVEIITPKIDTTLDPKRYNNLDSRIAARLFQMFHIGGFSAGTSGDDSLKLIRVVARGLEARRQAIRATVEENVLLPIYEANDDLKSKPKLQFTPRNVALDFDPNFIQLMLALYNDGSLSRDTMLGMVDVDQADEAHRRELEKELGWDDVFEPRNANNGMQGGIKGGNNNGGGDNPDSKVSNPVPRRPDADIPAGEE
jgi:hypothetical protein